MPFLPSLPADFAAREERLLGPRFAALYTYATEAPARGVTVNTLRCPPAHFAALADFALTPSPFCGSAFVTPDAAFRPGYHPYHHAGVFYAQEPSASAPAALLGVRPGMRVLDLCAAPGDKSSQLAAALAGQGLLVANEYQPARAEILRQNLERMGVTNAVVLNEEPARLAEALPGFFDRVLVDAPCSGEGMFRKEPAALAQHSAALVCRCAALGEAILEAAAALLAPGGVLVYSTCTFAPAEDEGQIAAFLARHPAFSLDDLSTVGFGSPGEPNRAGELPWPAAACCRRIWPSDGGEGHFMARLQKAGEARPMREAPSAAARDVRPTGKAAKTGRPGKNGKPNASGSLPADWQAFAAELLPALAQAPVETAGDWLILPPPLPWQPAGLRQLRAGVLAGGGQKGRFQPAHALFMAYGSQCRNREELTLADPRTAAWLRGEEIDARTAQNGWCAVLVDGFPLGGGKISGGRVKNHYPKGLRNLK